MDKFENASKMLTEKIVCIDGGNDNTFLLYALLGGGLFAAALLSVAYIAKERELQALENSHETVVVVQSPKYELLERNRVLGGTYA